MHEHGAPVLNRAIIGSILTTLNTKLGIFNLAYSKFDIA